MVAVVADLAAGRKRGGRKGLLMNMERGHLVEVWVAFWWFVGGNGGFFGGNGRK